MRVFPSKQANARNSPAAHPHFPYVARHRNLCPSWTGHVLHPLNASAKRRSSSFFLLHKHLSSAAPTASPRSADGGPASRQTDTPSTNVATSEHGRIPRRERLALVLQCVGEGIGTTLPQHVWHNEEAHVASSDVDLLQMANSTVSRGHGDVLELHVHVVLGCVMSVPIS